MVNVPDVLKPHSGGFAPSVRNLSGGDSITGFVQVVSSLQDKWAASYSFAINSDAKVLALRGFLMACRGRLNQVLLPTFDLARAPWRVDEYGQLVTPKAARTPRLDGTPFADAPTLRDNLIEARVYEAAAYGDTTLYIDVRKGSEPQIGHYLTIGDRLYTITDMFGTGPYRASVWPPLRSDLVFGTAINFTSTKCLMRLASDNEGQDALKSLQAMRHATVTLNFEEWPA